MKLSTKLIASFTSVIVLMLLIGVASLYFNNRIKNRVIDESRGAVKELEATSEMESYLYRSFINAQYYLDEPYRSTLDQNLRDTLMTVQNIKRAVRIELQGMNLMLTKLERLIKRDTSRSESSAEDTFVNRDSIDELKSGIKFYNSLMEQLLSYEQENFQNAKALLTVTIEPYYRGKLLPLVEGFKNQIQTNLDQQEILLNNRLNRYNNILLLATILAFLFSLIFAYLLYKSITTPIHSLAEAAEEIGSGNLKKRIQVDSNDEIGQLARSFNRMAENLNKITFSKAYVDNIIESMGDALIVTDAKGKIARVNSTGLGLLGYEEQILTGQHMSVILTESNKEALLSTEEKVTIDNYETRFERKNGQTFPVNLSKAVIYNSDETVRGLVFVASDITERKKSERMIKDSLQEKEMLLGEIHHRVKNNLAVISGILQMQRWETQNESAQEVLQDSQLRVKSIALVHEKLYQSENLSSIEFDQYVSELIKGISQTFKNSVTDVSFDIEIEPINFSIKKAIPCSLLLNELIVNAYKHAFGQKGEGKITIRMWEEDQHAHLSVKDNGVGLKEISGNGEETSLGMSLINTLVNQLEGDIEAYNDNGAAYDIRFAMN